MTRSVLRENGAQTKGNRAKVYWQCRLDELSSVTEDELRALAAHHLAKVIDDEVDTIPDAYCQYDEWIAQREQEHPEGWETERGERAEKLFESFTIMGRVEPAVEALRRLAGGELSAELEDDLSKIWALLERVERVRQLYESVPLADQWQLPWTSFVEPLRIELKDALLRLEFDADVEFRLRSIYISQRVARKYEERHRLGERPR